MARLSIGTEPVVQTDYMTGAKPETLGRGLAELSLRTVEFTSQIRDLGIHKIYPINYAHGFDLSWPCYQFYGLLLSFLSYPSGLLHWHWGNHMIAPVPVKQPWRIWVKLTCTNTKNIQQTSRVGNSVPAWNVSFWLLWRVRCDKCDGIVGIVLKYTWPQRYRHTNHNDTFHAGTCSGVKCIVVISVTVSLKLSLN